ncbi:hypothetical protein Terro_4178 [Terriglobus roseus DSM 18391]|uniref:Lipoprotein n=1 Tax=Terriglobus roseus (strain DSM 18391 / NRRL B-41598 / KBS 63) TaxID=926566 RepID=I3ZMB5_TERRK|nr:hypothetical protein [Terriglobus roseus]AFL90383.1 hypothetical protein Terro_4178 [Terriglobus roseus DSM 18391]
MASVRKIVAPLLAAAAVSILTGCRPKEMQRCVDEHDNVVDDKLCANLPQNAVQQQRPDGHGGFIPFILPYRYYYGGGGGYGMGSRVFGGGYQPQPNHIYGRPGSGRGGFFNGVTRGGFGSHFGGGGE